MLEKHLVRSPLILLYIETSDCLKNCSTELSNKSTFTTLELIYNPSYSAHFTHFRKPLLRPVIKCYTKYIELIFKLWGKVSRPRSAYRTYNRGLLLILHPLWLPRSNQSATIGNGRLTVSFIHFLRPIYCVFGWMQVSETHLTQLVNSFPRWTRRLW